MLRKLFILTIFIANVINCMEQKKNNIKSLDHIEEHKSPSLKNQNKFTFNKNNNDSSSSSSENDTIIEHIPEFTWTNQKNHFSLYIYIERCFPDHLDKTLFKEQFISFILGKIKNIPLNKNDDSDIIIEKFNTFFINVSKYENINYNFELHLQYVDQQACEKNQIIPYIYNKKKYSSSNKDDCCSIF